MKPEQQKIAIAEACGWKHTLLLGRTSVWDGLRGEHTKKPPNYPSDLNAMHEAEKVLQDHPKGWETYCIFLRRNFVRSDGAVSATAAQRAEAFLRTLNLWTT